MAQVKTVNIKMFEDTCMANTYNDKTKSTGQKMLELICIFSVLAGLFLCPKVVLI